MERSLSRQTERREKVAVRARRTLASVHGPRVATRRCQRGQLKAGSYTLSRLVIHKFTRTCTIVEGRPHVRGASRIVRRCVARRYANLYNYD